MECYVDDVVVK